MLRPQSSEVGHSKTGAQKMRGQFWNSSPKWLTAWPLRSGWKHYILRSRTMPPYWKMKEHGCNWLKFTQIKYSPWICSRYQWIQQLGKVWAPLVYQYMLKNTTPVLVCFNNTLTDRIILHPWHHVHLYWCKLIFLLQQYQQDIPATPDVLTLKRKKNPLISNYISRV